MTPRILAISNEDPEWLEEDKQQADDSLQAVVSGMAEEGYECRAFKLAPAAPSRRSTEILSAASEGTSTRQSGAGLGGRQRSGSPARDERNDESSVTRIVAVD